MSEKNNGERKKIPGKVSEWINSEYGIGADIIQGIRYFEEARKKSILAKNIAEKTETDRIEQEAQSLAEKAYVTCGIRIIRDIILSELKRAVNKSNNFIPDDIGNIFVEYSLVASTLDPVSQGKLQCCSFVTKGGEGKEIDDDFTVSIGKYYSAAIDKVEKDFSVSLYQHPNFLYNIGKEKYVLTKCEAKDKDENIEIEERPSNFYKVWIKDNGEKKGKLYVNTFQLDRYYSEMTSKARDILDAKLIGLEELQMALHKVLHNKITIDRGQSDSYYISFPIYGSVASNQLLSYKVGEGNPLQGIGACFIYFEPKINNLDEIVLNDAVSSIAYQIGNVIRFMSVNYLFNLGLQLQERARLESERAKTESIKSAKAAIMSRNMSHNLGSHVMAYLKQHLNSVQDMIRDNVLSQIIMPNEIGMDLSVWKKRLEETLETNLRELKEQKIKNGYIEQDTDTLIQVKEVALPFLVGLGKFISYLQERQDFIATIATAYAPYFSQVNFKDFIFDELNPDLRYERHSDRIGMKPDNILLGNIARSEGLARVTQPTQNKQEGMSDIVLKFRSFDGHIPVGKQKDDLDAMRDINISLPGGVIGRQAIFSIVENIIRNAAKHGTWGKKNGNGSSLELTFNLYEKKDILKEDIIPNDDAADAQSLGLLSFLRKYYLHTKDIDDLYVMTITDNMQFISNGADKWSLLCALNRAIIEPYIDELGVMVNANKGIKEMRISAAWMRGLDEREADAPINSDGTYFETTTWEKAHAPILVARPSKNSISNIINLQYIVCLQKPKTLAIITRHCNTNYRIKDGRTLKEMLDDNACKVMSKRDFINAPNKSFDFIIFNDLANEDGYSQAEYDEVRKLSHNRIFKLSDNRIDVNLAKNILSGDEGAIEKFIKTLYQILAKYVENDLIYIDDEKTNTKYNEDSKEYAQTLVHISKDYKHVYPYMYRTHHETEMIFSRFMTDSDLTEINNNLFVEGITGNNSTDRLVRNDDITDIWFYKHLHSMKTRVAIFDERIFSKVYRREEKELEQDIFNQLSDEQIKKYMRSAFSNKTNFKPKDFRQIKGRDQLTEYIRKNDVFLTDADYAGIQFNMKGVNVFTIIRRYDNSNKPNGLDIFGYFNYMVLDTDTKKCIYRSIIGRIGHISIGTEKDIIFNLYNEAYRNAFDYISIHQGLLDKIYEHFGIKKESEYKHQVTLKLYEAFANSPTDYLVNTYKEKENNVAIEKKGYFLPRLMVHSGRSKPSFVDMPQQQPFIQYSAIEHATLDCKYSLVELLDYARYEQE
ncbi:MAG: hypothetical protein IJ190_07580 [Prevotella sp.]|nr:hypothetical protein [Prevotella sp.]